MIKKLNQNKYKFEKQKPLTGTSQGFLLSEGKITFGGGR